jgi:hypothetical protein
VTGAVLDFEVGFEDLNVDEFALHGIGTFGAGTVECEITVMSQNETIHLVQHGGIPRQ